jgi:outer membrane protein assembly factor BamB
VFAFDLEDGSLLWRYTAPFDFNIKHAMLSGDLLVLSGKPETLALYVPTPHKNGEVAWQVKERGDLYIPPYFHGDRLVSVRKAPFNITVRYRATGSLIGRLDMPDLTLRDEHPLIEKGPRELPAAHDGRRLVVSDGWYYIMIDVEDLRVLWKRLIQGHRSAMRLFMGGDYLAVVKKEYDLKAILMLSSRTGNVLWKTDPKNARSPQPVYSALIDEDRLYGIEVYAGQGFVFTGYNAKTGKRLFKKAMAGYKSRPKVELIPAVHGGTMAARIQDRQNFELKCMDIKSGKALHTVKKKGVESFGVHGRVSATVQNGRMVLMSKNKLKY